MRVTPELEQELKDRLAIYLSTDETVQKDSKINIMTESGRHLFMINGRSDVSRENEIWELKFVSELSHVHALQLAIYLVAEKKETGYLWNTRTGERHEIHVPNREMFISAVTRAITKGRYKKAKYEIVTDI